MSLLGGPLCSMGLDLFAELRKSVPRDVMMNCVLATRINT